LAYNLLTLRKPAGTVLSLLFLAALAVAPLSSAQQQPGPARVSRLLLIIPFENTSTTPGLDWISESFPEVLTTQLSPRSFVMSREDRMSLKLQPTSDAYLVLARLDLAEGKAASARQNVDHALALDPANAVAAALKRDIAADPAKGRVSATLRVRTCVSVFFQKPAFPESQSSLRYFLLRAQLRLMC
jgi:hypothetical protein